METLGECGYVSFELLAGVVEGVVEVDVVLDVLEELEQVGCEIVEVVVFGIFYLFLNEGNRNVLSVDETIIVDAFGDILYGKEGFDVGLDF